MLNLNKKESVQMCSPRPWVYDYWKVNIPAGTPGFLQIEYVIARPDLINTLVDFYLDSQNFAIPTATQYRYWDLRSANPSAVCCVDSTVEIAL